MLYFCVTNKSVMLMGIFMLGLTLLSAEERRSWLVSKDHPWHEIEMKAYRLNLDNISQDEIYCVKSENAPTVNFFNIVVQKRLILNGRKSNYHKCIDDAFRLYPDNPLIRTKYAYQLFIYKRDFIEALKMLLPYVQENQNYPEINRDLQAIFDFFISNVKVFNEENAGKDSTYGYLYRLFDVDDFQELRRKILLLSDYWLLQIDRECNTMYPAQKYEIARAELEQKGGIENALSIWRNMVERLYGGISEETSVIASSEKTVPLETATNRAQNDTEKLKELLKELENSKLPLDINGVQYYATQFRRYRNVLKDETELPNIEELRKTANSKDIDILNLWYRLAVHGFAKETIVALEKIQGWDSEERLVLLKLHCLRELKAKKEELLPLANKLVDMAPGNKGYRFLKLSVELMDE